MIPGKQEKWDRRFLELAEHISSWSRDPSTKVGAVIVRPDKTIASTGYNGFPYGMNDAASLYDKREIKYERIVHGEMNAILHAKEPLHRYTLYTWPFFTCSRCAVHVITAGIKRVVAPYNIDERWEEELLKAQDFYSEVGVEFTILDRIEDNVCQIRKT